MPTQDVAIVQLSDGRVVALVQNPGVRPYFFTEKDAWFASEEELRQIVHRLDRRKYKTLILKEVVHLAMVREKHTRFEEEHKKLFHPFRMLAAQLQNA